MGNVKIPKMIEKSFGAGTVAMVENPDYYIFDDEGNRIRAPKRRKPTNFTPKKKKRK